MISKPIPKSLHTVTVLVATAQVFIDLAQYPIPVAVEMAVAVLGYTDTPDVYNLVQQATTKLVKINVNN